jgi:hypothetical protein
LQRGIAMMKIEVDNVKEDLGLSRDGLSTVQ